MADSCSVTIVESQMDISTSTQLYMPDSSTRRLLGAFYTPQSAADYMADWIIRHDDEHVLEPSFGDGIFLRAIAASVARKDFNRVHISGVEIDGQAKMRALQERLMDENDIRFEDFLAVSPFKVQAVIGNPPYVRLRHLPNNQRRNALKAAEVALRNPMDPSGSTWMPFVLHAMNFLTIGGRLAFVLPYEFTYVRYARPLWEVLRSKFGILRVLRTHERLFNDLLQDVVILLADEYGSRTDTIQYQAFERIDNLISEQPVIDKKINVDELLRGERVFVSALLGKELQDLLLTRIESSTIQARELVTFNIGYVSGDKSFFHPSRAKVQEYNLPSVSLRPSLTSSRAIKGSGIKTSSISSSRIDNLFLPNSEHLMVEDSRYIKLGEQLAVPSGYKCSTRTPWFIVPGVKIPNIILSVFSECPVLLINDAGYSVSNSLLCGYNINITSEEIAVRWYTSLTLLQCELEVHALGGGVMILVPREAGNIRLPKEVSVFDDDIQNLDNLLRCGKTEEAYRYGDNEVLIKQLGLKQSEVNLIHEGIEVLAHWRTSARTSKQ